MKWSNVCLWFWQIWVSSPHNASGYFMIYGDDSLHAEHFDSHLATGDTSSKYARTGFLGFVRRTELTQSDGGKNFVMDWYTDQDPLLIAQSLFFRFVEVLKHCPIFPPLVIWFDKYLGFWRSDHKHRHSLYDIHVSYLLSTALLYHWIKLNGTFTWFHCDIFI